MCHKGEKWTSFELKKIETIMQSPLNAIGDCS